MTGWKRQHKPSKKSGNIGISRKLSIGNRLDRENIPILLNLEKEDLENLRFRFDQYNRSLRQVEAKEMAPEEHHVLLSDQHLQNLDFWKDSFSALGKMAKKTTKVLDRGIERRKKAIADDLELTGKYVKKNGNFIGSDLYADIASGAGQLLNHGIDKKKLLSPKQKKALANQRAKALKKRKAVAAKKEQERLAKEKRQAEMDAQQAEWERKEAEELRKQQLAQRKIELEHEAKMAEIENQRKLQEAKERREEERRAEQERLEEEKRQQEEEDRRAEEEARAQAEAERLEAEKKAEELERERQIAQAQADEEARKQAEKQQEIDKAVKSYLQSKQPSSSSHPVVGSSHSMATEPTYVRSSHNRGYDYYDEPETPQTVNINYNYGYQQPQRRSRRHHSSRHSGRSHRRSYDDYDYDYQQPQRYNRWDDYDLYNLDANVDLTKNVVAQNEYTNDYIVSMPFAALLLLAYFIITIIGLKKVFGKAPKTEEQNQPITGEISIEYKENLV